MEWLKQPDWWLVAAVDANLRAVFSKRWETQCWLDLLLWAAGEEHSYPVQDWAGRVELDKPPGF